MLALFFGIKFVNFRELHSADIHMVEKYFVLERLRRFKRIVKQIKVE